jgi:N-acetylmuramoyl-L-alanine amidase
MSFTSRRALLAAAAGAVVAPLIAGPALAAPPKVYLDPGHGGSDPGATGNGLLEKNLTLAIALKTRDLLVARGASVRMSRTTDITRTLTWRTNDANAWGAKIFVSIHINSGGGTGFESYRYPTASTTTQQLHNIVHAKVLAGMNSVSTVTNRGKKTANFHVLRETSMPAILTENLFIDRTADANLLKRSDFITAIAKGHVEGIRFHLGI